MKYFTFKEAVKLMKEGATTSVCGGDYDYYCIRKNFLYGLYSADNELHAIESKEMEFIKKSQWYLIVGLPKQQRIVEKHTLSGWVQTELEDLDIGDVFRWVQLPERITVEVDSHLYHVLTEKARPCLDTYHEKGGFKTRPGVYFRFKGINYLTEESM